MVVRKDSKYANATSIQDFAVKVTLRAVSIWLPLKTDPDVQEQARS